ncbi:Transposase [compost metagenome]
MEKIRKKFGTEYKIFAVNLCAQYGSVLRVAQELGISKNSLYHWRRFAKKGTFALSKASYPDTGRAELSRLRKEAKNAGIERDILKKASHIFSRRDGQDTSLSGKIAIYSPSGRCAEFFRWTQAATTNG